MCMDYYDKKAHGSQFLTFIMYKTHFSLSPISPVIHNQKNDIMPDDDQGKVKFLSSYDAH